MSVSSLLCGAVAVVALASCSPSTGFHLGTITPIDAEVSVTAKTAQVTVFQRGTAPLLPDPI